MCFSCVLLLSFRRQALEGKRDRVDQGKQGFQAPVDNVSAKVNAEFVSSLQVLWQFFFVLEHEL